MENMNDEVSIKLTKDELLERGATLAAKNLHVALLREKKRGDAKSTQALIDAELDECERLSRVITGQKELRRQGDLFVDDHQAAETLAKVGAASCTCESEDVAAIDCPVHGTIPAKSSDPQAANETGDAGLAEEPDDEPADAAEPFPSTPHQD